MLFSEIYSTCALYLLALAFAGFLMIYCRSQKEVKCIGCQVIAYVVLIGALFGIIMMGYYKIFLWQHGGFVNPMPPIVIEVQQHKIIP